ncbi:MAG: sporulation integral membrane protein YtvI [Clostridia bacterium]|nr:sporulation integral membrane protein YtvI [Clostridia bacterium]MBR3863431.1 sporulation integral membrane protein YtvI [Clostridia bacterium]
MSEKKWVKYAAITVTVAGVLLALYLFFDFLLGILLPFLIAFLLAAVTHPAAKRFAARTRIPQKAVAAVFTLCALGLFATLIYLLFSRALLELQNFIGHLIEEQGALQEKISRVFDLFRSFFSHLPIELSGAFAWFEYFIEDPQTFFAEQMRGWLSRISEGIPVLVMRFVRALPAALLFLLVTLIACFYFSVEYETVTVSLKRLLPQKWQEHVPQLSAKARAAAGQYLRAYCLLFLITFGELFLGFLILRVNYVFLLAMLVALLDFLPIFGVGTVLLPWGVFSILTGNAFLGIGLVVLYAIITVIRQVIEPHIVGKSLGLHPILMLVALYAGLKIFGIIGVFAGPALALMAKVLLTREKADEVGK